MSALIYRHGRYPQELASTTCGCDHCAVTPGKWGYPWIGEPHCPDPAEKEANNWQAYNPPGWVVACIISLSKTAKKGILLNKAQIHSLQ